MTLLERHECLSSLYAEWQRMPDGEPARREQWFAELSGLIADMPKSETRAMWIDLFANAIHTKHNLPLSICTYIVLQRVEAAQKGGLMYRENVRMPIAASGTSAEYLGKDQDEFIPKSYARSDMKVLSAAFVLGIFILSAAFWPVILGWMTEFKYGVLAGALGMAAFLIGGLAVGVCLGAGRLEKRS